MGFFKYDFGWFSAVEICGNRWTSQFFGRWSSEEDLKCSKVMVLSFPFMSNIYTSKEKPSCVAMFSRQKRQVVSPASVLQVFQDNQKLLIPLDHLQKIRFQGLSFLGFGFCIFHRFSVYPHKEKCCVHVWLSPNDHVIVFGKMRWSLPSSRCHPWWNRTKASVNPLLLPSWEIFRVEVTI